jgi:flagellar basal body-associated protein FliL
MFDLESLKMDFSNPMMWVGLVLMVVAIAGYFWMNSNKEEEQPPAKSVSFDPSVQLMADQPTTATCIINENGEQVCN